MKNWRTLSSTSPDRPGSSSNSMLNRSSQNQRREYFGPQRETRESFRQVEDLIELNNKSSSEIIIQLTEKLDDFSVLLTSPLQPNWIVHIIAILSKVCSSSFRETKLDVLRVAMNGYFLHTLERYVRNLKYRTSILLDNPEEFLVNVRCVYDAIINIIPTDYCDTLHNMVKVTEFYPNPGEEWQKNNSNFKVLIEKLKLCKEHPEISAFPNIEEILTSNSGLNSKYFVEGKYGNVNLYLDAQVKLLKDNFAAALLQDIAKCIEHTHQGPNGRMQCSTIRMYPDVVFGSMVFNYDYCRTGVIVKFSNKEDLTQIFSPRTRGFKCGSVVCFTKDNFYSVFFGKVIKKKYRPHSLIIGFETEFNKNYETDVPYTMVECNVHLYPYYDILRGLPSMSEVDFPLKSYLIGAVPQEESPGYLESTSTLHLVQGSRRVDVFGSDWPSADQLQLDPTQYSAFKAALTQKFVMIQGAPGTGKTYLGLQIVKTLVHEDNQKLWYNEAPILIVCLSNQVLDHFLEGLISTTNRIIRVGEQSTSEKLVDFTLKSARKRCSVRRNIVMVLNKKRRGLLRQLEKYQDCLNNIKNLNFILNFSSFGSIDEELQTSWFSGASSADMLTWLFDGQSRSRHTSKISEIIENITEEQKQFDIEEDITASGEQRNISGEEKQNILCSKSLWIQMVRIKNQVQKMKTGGTNQSDEQNKLETQLKNLWQNYQCFKMMMSHWESAQTVSKPRNVDYQLPHSMDPNDRWNLYFYWIILYKDFVEEKFLELQFEHRQLSQKTTEIQNMLDLEIMKGALVLGMTFNAVARLQAILQSLKCRIVVVEEACTVSESHIVVSLTKHCENLILLDTHQELCRGASRTVIRLGINMMDRMMRNGMQCHILRMQYRSRPEIVELLFPLNYPELENHHSVTKFPPVLGIPSCNYFVHHEHQDVEQYNSITNLYEATFLVKLTCHLRQVGYQAEDITILTAYFGQKNILYDESKKHKDLLNGVLICTLDDYQSENCKIVLLSLVRNNTEGKIGHLEFEDFVISALSRAKEALYMMGNIDLLCQKSKMWTRIKEVLVKQNCLGDHLPVCCKVNPDHVTKIKEPKDFDEFSENVCNKICGRLLQCGHRCSKSCHSLEDDHAAMVCTEICST